VSARLLCSQTRDARLMYKVRRIPLPELPLRFCLFSGSLPLLFSELTPFPPAQLCREDHPVFIGSMTFHAPCQLFFRPPVVPSIRSFSFFFSAFRAFPILVNLLPSPNSKTVSFLSLEIDHCGVFYPCHALHECGLTCVRRAGDDLTSARQSRSFFALSL